MYAYRIRMYLIQIIFMFKLLIGINKNIFETFIIYYLWKGVMIW